MGISWRSPLMSYLASAKLTKSTGSVREICDLDDKLSDSIHLWQHCSQDFCPGMLQSGEEVK